MIVQVRTVKPKPGVRAYKRCEDCRRTSVILRLRVRHTRRLLADQVGRPVRYYADGWRCGYLVSLGASRASIQPIGAMGGICPNVLTVPISDVKLEESPSLQMPTVQEYYMTTKKTPVLIALPIVGTLVSSGGPGSGMFAKGSPIDFPAVQETNIAIPLTGVRKSKHAPIDFVEAARLYLLGTRMSAVVEAVRGSRAAGGCANDVRNYLRAQGIYKEPTKCQ